MKKYILLALLVGLLGISCGMSYAEDWNEYESGRNNIRLDGYHGQPGYIAFYDGNGNVVGYLFASVNRLKWITPSAVNLDTTKLLPNWGSTITLEADEISDY